MHLASALVKLARLAVGAPMPLCGSTVLGSGPVERRVRHLLADAGPAEPAATPLVLGWAAAALLVALVLALTRLDGVYTLVERVVSALA